MKYTIAAIVVLAGLAACPAQSDKPETLADVARKMKAGKKAAVVVSDENMRRTSRDSVSVVGPDRSSQSSSSLSTPEANGSATASAAKQELGSAAAAKNPSDKGGPDLKKELDKAKAQQQGWENSAKHYEDLLQNEKDDFRRQMYQDALNNDRGNATMYKRKADDIESQLNKQKEAAASSTDGAQSAHGGGHP